MTERIFGGRLSRGTRGFDALLAACLEASGASRRSNAHASRIRPRLSRPATMRSGVRCHDLSAPTPTRDRSSWLRGDGDAATMPGSMSPSSGASLCRSISLAE